MLGRLSNNLAFVTKPQQQAQTFKHVQLIWLSPHTGVAIVVTSLGVMTQSLFELGAEVQPDDLTRFSSALNAHFADRPMHDVSDAEIARAAREAGVSDDLRVAVVAACQNARSSEQPSSRRPARRTCSTSPSFRTCASCARFCASWKSRRRSTKSWQTL